MVLLNVQIVFTQLLHSIKMNMEDIKFILCTKQIRAVIDYRYCTKCSYLQFQLF